MPSLLVGQCHLSRDERTIRDSKWESKYRECIWIRRTERSEEEEMSEAEGPRGSSAPVSFFWEKGIWGWRGRGFAETTAPRNSFCLSAAPSQAYGVVIEVDNHIKPWTQKPKLLGKGAGTPPHQREMAKGRLDVPWPHLQCLLPPGGSQKCFGVGRLWFATDHKFHWGTGGLSTGNLGVNVIVLPCSHSRRSGRGHS